MANYNIPDLDPISSLSDTDLIEVFSGVANWRGTIAQLKTALGAGIIDWDLSSNAYPTGGKPGQMYNGKKISTATTLTDKAGNILPDEVLGISLISNPTTASHFIFIVPLF